MDDEELLTINGGQISATMLNAISRYGSMILELGRTFGTIILKFIRKNPV